MKTMAEFYTALEEALKATPDAYLSLDRASLLRIVYDEQVYCPITFVAQIRGHGDFGNHTGLAHAAGYALGMPHKAVNRVINGADNNGSPVVRRKLQRILHTRITAPKEPL